MYAADSIQRVLKHEEVSHSRTFRLYIFVFSVCSLRRAVSVWIETRRCRDNSPLGVDLVFDNLIIRWRGWIHYSQVKARTYIRLASMQSSSIYLQPIVASKEQIFWKWGKDSWMQKDLQSHTHCRMRSHTANWFTIQFGSHCSKTNNFAHGLSHIRSCRTRSGHLWKCRGCIAISQVKFAKSCTKQKAVYTCIQEG